MVIIFLTTQAEICHIMENQLKEHSCFVFSKPETFFTIIRNLKVPPDLLVMDYTLFNHDIFNVYEQMKIEQNQFPAIFYNEPCTSKLSRSDFWKYIINYENGFSKKLDTKKYIPVFKVIEKIVESPQLREYIPLMQTPKPLPKNFAISKFYDEETFESLESQMYKIKKNIDISDSLFYLLSIFYKNYNTYITLEEIQKEYIKTKRNISLNSLKVNISKLKSKIKKVPNLRIIIYNDKNGYKLVQLI